MSMQVNKHVHCREWPQATGSTQTCRRRYRSVQACLKCASDQLLQSSKAASLGAFQHTVDAGAWSLPMQPCSSRPITSGSNGSSWSVQHVMCCAEPSGTSYNESSSSLTPTSSSGTNGSSEPQLDADALHSTPISEQADASSESEQPDSVGVRVALSMLRFYKQAMSPLMAPACR